MKYAIILLTIIATNIVFAKEVLPLHTLDKTEKDNSLSKDEAVYRFTFHNMENNDYERTILYSIDGKQEPETPLTEGSYIEIKTTPGKHVFQFFYSRNYVEVSMDSLEIQKKTRAYYSIYLERRHMEVRPAKPVIYLYPEKRTEVKLTVDIVGEPIFMYPEYNEAWEFSAHPSGDLKFNDKTYNYLFWESSQNIPVSSLQNRDGFIVEGAKAISFLEDKLSNAGLTSKEQADFITYWGPRLQENKFNFIRFEFNEECNQYARLDITPSPESIYRIFMIWHPTEVPFKVKEQQITPAKRDGFTVIEWGGYEAEEPNLIN